MKNVSASTAMPKMVIGRIKSRWAYKKGFGIIVGDRSGEMRVEFWDGAVTKFKDHPALQKGWEVMLMGFEVRKLKDDELEWNTGRQHKLVFTEVFGHEVVLTDVPAKPRTCEAVRTDKSKAVEKAVVSIAECYVAQVGELESKYVKRVEKGVAFRAVWLTDNLSRGRPAWLKWTMWAKAAIEFRATVGNKVSIHEATVDRYESEVFLTGGKPKFS